MKHYISTRHRHYYNHSKLRSDPPATSRCQLVLWPLDFLAEHRIQHRMVTWPGQTSVWLLSRVPGVVSVVTGHWLCVPCTRHPVTSGTCSRMLFLSPHPQAESTCDIHATGPTLGAPVHIAAPEAVHLAVGAVAVTILMQTSTIEHPSCSRLAPWCTAHPLYLYCKYSVWQVRVLKWCLTCLLILCQNK